MAATGPLYLGCQPAGLFLNGSVDVFVVTGVANDICGVYEWRLPAVYFPSQIPTSLLVIQYQLVYFAHGQQIAEKYRLTIAGLHAEEQASRVFHLLIAGFVVRVGDTLYDGSVKTRFERARKSMIERAIENIETRPEKFFNGESR